MYRVLVVGAGYLGSSIAAYFRFENQKVWAVIRTDKRKQALEQIGAVPIVADITQPKTLAPIPAANFVVICVTPQGDDAEAYYQTYVEGVGNILSHIKTHAQPALVVYISSTGVYGDHGGEWVDEEVVPVPDDLNGDVLLDAERQVLEAELPVVIYRLGGIYGPSRNWIPAFKRGHWETKKEDRYMNMIHVEDIVASMPVLFNKSEYDKVYLGVDDEPVLRSEFTKWMNKKLGIKGEDPAADTPLKITGKRCRNTRLKSLGFKFRYPTFRPGYDNLLWHTSRELKNADKKS